MRIPTEFMFQQQQSLLSQQTEKFNRLMIQQTKGKKLLSNSDDPILGGRIDSTLDHLNDIASYKQNNILAKNRMTLFDGSMFDAINTTDQIRQLITRAGSDTMPDADRLAIAEQIKGYLNTLVNDANAKDGNGDYIYSGFNSNTQAYAQVGGKYIYQGSKDTAYINIGTNNSVQYSESGDAVFGNILNGNGVFTVTAGSGNTGSAFTSVGSIFDKNAYVEDTYTITFVTNSDGKLAYQVTGLTSGQVIPPPPATIPADAPEFKPDSDIAFNGQTLHISGEVKVGDTFTAAPSTKKNVFDSLNDLITALQMPIDNDPVKRAQFHQAINQSNAEFSRIYDRFTNYRSNVGTRAQEIQNQETINTSLETNQTAIYKSLSEADPYQVASELAQSSYYLQATLDTYKLIQGVLLQMLSR